MLYLRMYKVDLTPGMVARLADLKVDLGRTLRPLMQPTIEAPATILGVSPNMLVHLPRAAENALDPSSTAIDGEVYTDGESLIALALHVTSTIRDHLQVRQNRLQRGPSHEVKYRLDISAIGPCWDPPSLLTVLSAVNSVIGVDPTPFFYSSNRFAELKEEGREPPAAPTPEELKASEILCDKDVRTLAIAIKTAGGLLVRDLAKQLPPESRDRNDTLIMSLKSAQLVDSEIVVVCSKTQAQVTRATNRELLNDASMKGLKCACGRSLIEERIEEALAITDLGRGLLDKGRWLTLRVVQELEAVGVSRDSVLVEQTVGGDEIDCLANISGELVLFELKDKEFSLGSAYSFGAKMGIISPRHPVIVTTAQVGNDAKEHFVRAQSSGASRYEAQEREKDIGDIRYIEGIQNLRKGIQDLASDIYKSDAIVRLNRVLTLAALSGRSVVEAIQNVKATQARGAGGIA